MYVVVGTEVLGMTNLAIQMVGTEVLGMTNLAIQNGPTQCSATSSCEYLSGPTQQVVFLSCCVPVSNWPRPSRSIFVVLCSSKKWPDTAACIFDCVPMWTRTGLAPDTVIRVHFVSRNWMTIWSIVNPFRFC
jgi:hypothetical protein